MRFGVWTIQAAALAAFGLAAAGCVLDIETHRDYRRPVYVEQPTYDPQHVVVVDRPPGDQVVVSTAQPPAPYSEPIPVAPGPDMVWIEGNWVISGGGWVWVHGHYEHPPRHGARWEPHRWERHGDRWELRPGGWH